MNIPEGLEVHYIDEYDIVQFNIGLQCDSFILSESTFHWWIAYLKWIKSNRQSKVLVYNDTDFTNRPLTPPGWIKIDYFLG